jgi:peroxiredoxin Q/BCP
MLEIGKNAPRFTLPDTFGNKVALKDFLGKKVVLYFYPKDNTSGCTMEANDFKANIKKFEKLNAVVLGVSKDSQKSHQKFVEKFDLPFTLLSDEETKVIQKYGVWKEKSMYGRKYMGVERSTFIIDEKGKLIKIYPKVKVKGHVEEVLNFLKENK